MDKALLLPKDLILSTNGLAVLAARARGRALHLRVIPAPARSGDERHAGLQRHAGWELFAPVEMPVVLRVGRRTVIRGEPGTALLLHPETPHRIDNEHDLAGCAGHALVTVTCERDDEVHVSAWASGAATQAAIGPAQARAFHEMAGSGPGRFWSSRLAQLPLAEAGSHALFLEGLLKLYLGALHLALCRADDAATACGGPPAIVGRAVAFLKLRCADPETSLADVADACGRSPTYLTHLMKTTTGESLWQALLRIRIENARTLLASGRYSIKEVARLTGWKDPLHFSRTFRRKVGLSPRAWLQRAPLGS